MTTPMLLLVHGADEGATVTMLRPADRAQVGLEAARENALTPAAVTARSTAVDAALAHLGLDPDSTLALALTPHLADLWRAGAVYGALSPAGDETPAGA